MVLFSRSEGVQVLLAGRLIVKGTTTPKQTLLLSMLVWSLEVVIKLGATKHI